MKTLNYSRPSPPYPSLPLVSAGAGNKSNPGAQRRKTGSRQPKPMGQRGHRILVIDDDPSSLELFSCLLEDSGYILLLSSNGAEGLAIARFQRPALIICDIRLPKLSGEEIVHYLKADPVLRWTPVVAVTAFGTEREREHYLAKGFDGYLTKPIEPGLFVGQIANILNQVRH
ncbi:MAG: response regulator [Deltaproteobacteria bacterium]|nr:response regulator [Deltaproteobacteria bacterium]